MVTQHLDEQERQPLLQSPRNNDFNDPSNKSRKQPYTATPIDDLQEEGDDESATPPWDEAARLAYIQAMPWYKRASPTWLLPFVLLLALIMGIVQAPQEQLTIRIICKEHLQNNTGVPLGVPLVASLSVPTYSTEITTPSNIVNSYDSSFWNRNKTEERERYDENPCNAAPVQAYAALVLSRVRSLKFVTAIFTVGFYTSMSDRYGRKFMVYCTLLPALLTQALIIYLAQPTVNIGAWALYVDALMMGLTGGGLLLDPSLTAYIADCTPTKGRSLAIGFIMVSLAVGVMVGPVIGSVIYNWTHDETTAIYVSIATFLFLIMYTLVMPESLPKELRSKVKPKATEEVVAKEKIPALKALKNAITDALDPLMLFLPGRIDTTVGQVKLLPTKYTLMIMVSSYGLLQFSLYGTSIMMIPYTNLVFHWTTYEDGFYLAFTGFASFVVYVVIFPGLQKLKAYLSGEKNTKNIENIDAAPIPPAPIDQITELDLGNAESRYLSEQAALDESATAEAAKVNAAERLASVRNDLFFIGFGAAAYSLSYLILFGLRSEPVFFAANFLRTMGSVFAPSFASLVTTVAPPDKIGKVLGGVCIMDTIVMSVSSLLYGWVFSKTSGVMPSAIYLMSMVITLSCGFILISVWYSYRRSAQRKAV